LWLLLWICFGFRVSGFGFGRPAPGGTVQYARASQQVPLASIWITAGNKGFTQDGKPVRRMVTPDLHNLGSSKLVASFVIRVPSMAFEPLPGDTMAPGGFFELPL
jgi:hypothetical protein